MTAVSDLRREPAAGPARAARRRARRWTRWDTRALVIIVVAAGVRAWLLSRSWFWQDDFLVADGAARTTDLRAWVLQDYNGHLEPLKFLQAWIMMRTVGMSWTAAAAITLLWTAAFGAAAWALLRRVVGPGPAALAGAAVASLCPLWSVSASWFASAMESLPSITLMTVCAWCAAAVAQGRSGWWGAGAVVSFAGALLWYEKGALLLLLVALAVVGVRLSGRHAPLRRRGALLTALGLVAVVLAYAALFLALAGAPPADPAEPSEVARLAYEMGLSVVPTGLVGGPWQQNADGSTLQVLITQPWIVWIWAVLCAVLVVALRRHRAAAVVGTAAVILLLVVDIALVARSRIEFLGPVIGRDTRYTVDVVPVAALALALAIGGGRRGAAARLGAPARRLLTRGAFALGLLYAVVAWPSVYAVGESRASIGAQEWVGTALAGIEADPGRVLVGTPVPPRIVSTAFGDAALSSHVLALFGVDPDRFDRASSSWWVVNSEGRVVPVTYIVEAGGQVGRVPGCGVALGGRPTQLDVPAVPEPKPGQIRATRLSYYSARPATVVVEAGGTRSELDLPAGLGYAYLPSDGSGGTLTVGGLGADEAVCIAALHVGSVG